jgi:hypothetical protein
MVLAAGGCTDVERSHVAQFADALFGDDEADVPHAPIPAQMNPKCRAVALERSSDVLAQGYDGAVARSVYNSVYADCVAWAQRGADVR